MSSFHHISHHHRFLFFLISRYCRSSFLFICHYHRSSFLHVSHYHRSSFHLISHYHRSSFLFICHYHRSSFHLISHYHRSSFCHISRYFTGSTSLCMWHHFWCTLYKFFSIKTIQHSRHVFTCFACGGKLSLSSKLVYFWKHYIITNIRISFIAFIEFILPFAIKWIMLDIWRYVIMVSDMENGIDKQFGCGCLYTLQSNNLRESITENNEIY